MVVIVPADLANLETHDGFTPQERAIFAYNLGKGRPDYHADPLAIEDRYELLIANQNPEAIGQWLKRENLSTRLMGLRRLLPVMRSAFALPAFDEANPDGLTAGDSFLLLERFFAYQDRIKAKYRREAELLVTYGPMPNRPHTYERECGLWWNRARSQAFSGVASWRAAVAASGTAKADFNLVDAMAPNLEAAYELEDQIESDRATAEARAHAARKG